MDSRVSDGKANLLRGFDIFLFSPPRSSSHHYDANGAGLTVMLSDGRRVRCGQRRHIGAQAGQVTVLKNDLLP